MNYKRIANGDIELNGVIKLEQQETNLIYTSKTIPY